MVYTGQRGPCVWKIIDVLKQFRGANGFKKGSCHKPTYPFAPWVCKNSGNTIISGEFQSTEEMVKRNSSGQHLKDLSNFSLRKQGYQPFFQEAVNHQRISFQMLWTVIASMKHLIKWLYKSHKMTLLKVSFGYDAPGFVKKSFGAWEEGEVLVTCCNYG